MAVDFHQGEVGAEFRILVKNPDGSAKDISAASVKEIRFKFQKTGATRQVKTAAFVTNGADGLLKYVTTSADDIDDHGDLQAQGYVEISGAKRLTEIVTYEIGPAL